LSSPAAPARDLPEGPKSFALCPLGRWLEQEPRRKAAVRASPCLWPSVSQRRFSVSEWRLARDILYGLNGRRTNRVRIGDKP
jgi:hypothetical protein